MVTESSSRATVKNPYIAGRPVEAQEMFFGRQDVFEFIRRNLIGQFQNNAIVLYGRPRTGKTSILKQMHHYLGDSHICVYMDLNGVNFAGMGNFLWQVADSIWLAMQAGGVKMTPPLEQEFSLEKDPGHYFATNFLPNVEKNIGDRRLLVMFDETERLWEAIRVGKIDPDIIPYMGYLLQNQSVVNPLFCMGSQPRVVEHEFNQLLRLSVYKEISFLERDAAMTLITRPVQGLIKYSQASVEEIYNLTSGHPYFIQMICHSLFNHWQGGPRDTINVRDVEAVLDEVVESSWSHMKDTWERFTNEEKAILAALAENISTEGRANRQDIERVLDNCGIPLARGQVTIALQSLSETHFIYPDEPYLFRVDIFRRWIHAHKKTEWVREEISAKVSAAEKKAVERPDEVRRYYLQHVRNSCKHLDFRGLMLLPELFTLPLSEIYVPLHVSVARSEELFKNLALRARARYLAEEMTTVTQDISLAMQRELADEMRRLAATLERKREDTRRLLKEHPRLVILGEPGSGKTTFLRYVALTFAEGRQAIKERLELDADWLPVLISIGSYAAARRVEPELSLADYVPRYFPSRELDLPELSLYLQQALKEGHCLVLLDGLDTVIDNAERQDVARQVEAFINQYVDNRFVVTSRIEGYREAPLVGDYLHCTASDLEMPEIERFAYQWSLACETQVVDTPEKRAWAKVQASRLIEAIRTAPGVRRLSANPLLLTIIALAHRQGRLPRHRIALYSECARTLIERWNQVRSTAMQSVSLPMDATEAFRNFGPLALWMHEEKRGGAVTAEEIRTKLKELLVDRGLPEEDASTAAHTFLEMERNQVGLLVERGVNAYGFSHLTFQEYFATRAIVARRDKVLDKLREHSHDPRWREVVLLTAGQIGVQQTEEEAVTGLVQAIAKSNSPYENILHRDLLLAGRCLADDVGVGYREREALLNQLLSLWHAARYERLGQEITDILSTMRDTACEAQVVKALLADLAAKDLEVCERAADVLGHMGMTSDTVLNALTETLRKDSRAKVRAHAALALSRLNVAPERVTRALAEALKEDSDREVRQRAAEALAYVGEANEQAINLLLAALGNSDGNVRGSAAAALTSLRTPPDSLVHALLKALGDSRVDVRTHTADILGRLGQRSSIAVSGLIQGLQDPREDARISAVMALGQVGDASEKVVTALIKCLADDSRTVRKNAAAALGKLGARTDNVISALERALKDEQTSVGAADALGRAGRGDMSIASVTERQLQADDWRDRIQAVEALVSLDKQGQSSQKVIETLAAILQEEHRMEWDLQTGTAITLAEAARRSDGALSLVIKLLDSESWMVRAAAAEALGLSEKNTPEVIGALIHTLEKDGDDHARGNAATALGSLGRSDEAVVTILVKALDDFHGYVRLAAAEALSKLGARCRKPVLDGLVKLLEDGYYSHYHDKHVRDAAFEALWILAPHSSTEPIQ